MAKIDAYKLVGQGGNSSSAMSPVAVHAARANIKAFAGIQYSLRGIQSTLVSMEKVELNLIENDKLRAIAERRRKRRELDRLAEERAETPLSGASAKAAKGELKGKDKKKADSLFSKLFGGLEGLALIAGKFLLKLIGLVVVKEILKWVANPENRQKLIEFFRKTKFVFEKIYGFTKWLVGDNLLPGITQAFGKDSTFGERVSGLFKIMTAIGGMALLLNPFGTMDAILSLLGLDFYRDKTARVADALDDVYIDGPDGQKRRYRKNPSTGKWEEIGPDGKPVKPGTTKPGTTKPGTTTQPGSTKPGTTKPGTTKPYNAGNNKPVSRSTFALEQARKENARLRALAEKLKAENKTLLGKGTGSNILGRGLKNAPGRAMTFVFGKNKRVLTNLLGKPTATALKAGVRNFAGRIPWFGGFLVAAFSMLDGDPIDRTLFQTAGTLIGGAVGSFIPIIGQIGIGTILGSIVGQYMGDLLYMLANPDKPDGGIEQVKRKIFEDSLDLWNGSKAAVKALWNWVGPKIMEAGNFIATGIKRFYQAIPLFEFPSVTIPGWIPGFGNKKIGGFEVVNPIFFTPVAALQQMEAMKKAFFEQDKPITRVKMPTLPEYLKQVQDIFNWLGGLNQDGTSRAGQTGGRAKAKADAERRRAEDAAKRQEEREQTAALNAARDAFLEKNKIRQYDPKQSYREMELVYKMEGKLPLVGFGFGTGYKDYHVFRNGKLIHVKYYGNLHEKNFKSKKAFEIFLAGGGNAMLRGKANYDVKKVLELGFAATAKLNKTESVGSGESTTPVVTKTEPATSTQPQTGGNANAGALFDLVTSAEGGLNSVNRGEAGDTRGGARSIFGKDLTDMTVDEIYKHQKAGKVHAVGKYQIIPMTMPGFMQYLRSQGIDTSKAKFDANIQSMFGPYSITQKRPEVGRFLKGDKSIDIDTAQLELAAEFASIGVPYDMKKGSYRGSRYPLRDIKKGESLYSGVGENYAHAVHTDQVRSMLQQMRGGGSVSPSSVTTVTTPAVQPKTSFTVDLNTSTINADTGKYTPVGQKATLQGKPVIWDGTTWQPDPEGGSEDSPTKSQTTTPQDGRGYAILPYQSDPSDTALPFEQAKSIAEGILGKKYTAYDLGSVGGLKEGGLQAAVDAYKSGDGTALQSAFDQLSNNLGTGSSAGVPVRDTLPTPEPGEDGYAGPKSDINPLDYSDQSGLLKDNTGKTYTPEDILREIGGDPKVGPVNPDTYGGVRGFDLRDLFGNNRGLNPYGPDGRKADMWTNSTGWQDKIPGFGDFSIDTGYSTDVSLKSSSIDFSKVFGFSAGGKVPNNLKPFFLGGIFKGIKKAFSGVVKAVSSVVSGVGNFLNSPLGSILTTAISFVPGFQWVAPVVQGFKAAAAIAQGDILGAVTNTVGALTGFFPETMGNFFTGVTDTLGEGLGGVVNGFLQGGIGGAIGGIGGMLGPGVQKFLGGIGDFIKNNPVVGSIIKSIPGIANIPGLSNLFGLEEFPGMPGPIGVARTLAGQFGMGSLFDGMLGIAGMTQQGGLMQQAGELGVDPRAFGIFNNASGVSAFDPKGGISSEYAMQTALEFVPVPMILLKLVPIDRPVPINSVRVVRQPAKPAPPPPQK